jgi:hypothetical protein
VLFGKGQGGNETDRRDQNGWAEHLPGVHTALRTLAPTIVHGNALVVTSRQHLGVFAVDGHDTVFSPQPAATKQQEQDEDRQRQQRNDSLTLLPRPVSDA